MKKAIQRDRAKKHTAGQGGKNCERTEMHYQVDSVCPESLKNVIL